MCFFTLFCVYIFFKSKIYGKYTRHPLVLWIDFISLFMILHELSFYINFNETSLALCYIKSVLYKDIHYGYILHRKQARLVNYVTK